MKTRSRSEAVVSAPRITLQGIVVVSVCWILYATLYSFMVAASGQDNFTGVYLGQLWFALIQALLSIPPWWLVVKKMEQFRWPAKILVHIGIAPIYAWIALAFFLSLIARYTTAEVYEAVADSYVFLYGNTVMVYVVQFALYHAIRIFQRLRHEEKQAAELLALARQSELAALKAQINPHFLFNTLNAINAMVIQDPEETRNMIVQLGDMIRYTLDSSRRDFVALSEELAFVQAYLKLETHRFAERLQVEIDVPPEASQVQIPPMILQPLIENAIKHGISRRERGGTITIRVVCRGDVMDVEIEDRGKGDLLQQRETVSTGIGLANTSERLEKTFGEKARLKIEDLSPKGFNVAFSIPKN